MSEHKQHSRRKKIRDIAAPSAASAGTEAPLGVSRSCPSSLRPCGVVYGGVEAIDFRGLAHRNPLGGGSGQLRGDPPQRPADVELHIPRRRVAGRWRRVAKLQ
ncbi:hypothetical protein THAOC_15913 [Thalassiosira oceanica]|uniref:Uncharacterized protein n=1 Tax=Thalassiosira oceanica TaxID=159749 RepID=K0SDG1_THAOC|nr:hypothetical protein THAOC_15913 [Thalassiosira oceanica]|eukprot:EJK63425.1 hypothetical protein THAOC_15913 [Thalassiosira oceanica]